MNPETNPENANGLSQSAANQSSSQNTINQNAAFPGQNLPPVQNSFAQNLQPVQDPPTQNLPLQTSPPKSKRPVLIACIIGALVLILAVVGVVCFVVMQDDNGPADDKVSSVADSTGEAGSEAVEGSALDATDVMDVEKFKQMTKAEALAFLEAGRSTAGSMPKNYVGKEITDLVIVENNVVLSDVSLKYSHETLDDLRQIAEDWYGILGHNDGITENDYEIKEYDYYAIVTPNRVEGTNTCDYEYYGDCDSLLSFKRDYLNYFQEETSPHSYNDVAYLNTQNLELVEDLLRVYSFFYSYGAASTHGNIYGSSFEERDDSFVLTVYYVGVGLNMEKLKVNGNDIEYAINLYSRQYAADKADGRLHAIRTGENSTIENIKSIPITNGEAASLLSR